MEISGMHLLILVGIVAIILLLLSGRGCGMRGMRRCRCGCPNCTMLPGCRCCPSCNWGDPDEGTGKEKCCGGTRRY